MTEELNELIVFVVRETGWTLEYIRSIPVSQLYVLAEELKYQEAAEEYRRSYDFAIVLANWATSKGKKRFKPQDFIGSPPKRKGDANG